MFGPRCWVLEEFLRGIFVCTYVHIYDIFYIIHIIYNIYNRFLCANFMV